MIEAMLPYAIGGALISGAVLGIVGGWLRWPAMRAASISAAVYIATWYVVGYAMIGLPETFGQLVGGSVLVLPGFVLLLGLPLAATFLLGHWAMQKLTGAPSAQ